jgi:hypothetical protein
MNYTQIANQVIKRLLAEGVEIKDVSKAKAIVYNTIKPPKPKQQIDDFIGMIINAFEEEYKNSKKISYNYSNKQKERQMARKVFEAYKKLLKDIDTVMPNTEQTIIDLKMFFRKALKLKDDFLVDNISLSFIASNFNRYYINIKKNGKNKESGSTTKELVDKIAEKIGYKY